MAGQLTASENMLCLIKELPFTTSSTYTLGDFVDLRFPNPLKVKATECIILQFNRTDNLPITEAVSLDWYDYNGTIVIRNIAGLDDETSYFLRVRVS